MSQLRLPPILKYQADAIFTDRRYAVVEGSTKVGKTFPCIIWLLTQAGINPATNRNFWWVAPTIGQSEIAYTRTKAMLTQADPKQSVWAPNEQKRKIMLRCYDKNGNPFEQFVWFKTGEEPDNLYGEDVYAAVMDEFTRQRAEAWHALRSTLSATGGRCRFVGNVKGKKNWGYHLARRAERGDPSMTYAKLTAYDAVAAGIMPADEIEQAKIDLPEAVFRELYLAEPSEDGSNPFGLQYIRQCVMELSKEPPVVFGIDLARKVDYTVVIGLDAEGRVCRFDRWNKRSWEHTTNAIAEMVGNTRALMDSTGIGDVVFERLGRVCRGIEPYQFTSKSKQALMESLAVSIQNHQIGYPSGVIVEELESFEYSTTGRSTTYSAPDGYHDDCVCALALAALKHERQIHNPVNLMAGFGGDDVDTMDDDGPVENPGWWQPLRH